MGQPVCGFEKCSATCSTINYQCKAGVRVDALNNTACVDGHPSSNQCEDSNCCRQCNDDGDCADPSTPYCQSEYPEHGITYLGQCYECMSDLHCADGKTTCVSGQYSPCRSQSGGGCTGPCVEGRYGYCELPCHHDSDCVEGEICALNPDESDFVHGAKRCQKQCGSNDDCEYFLTCVLGKVNGRRFCGRCDESTAWTPQCPTGQKCDSGGRCVDSSEFSEASSLVV